jgi:hypothetical protein
MTRWTALALVSVSMLPGQRAAAEATEAEIDGRIAEGRLGEAVRACETLTPEAFTPALKATCAKAALGLGDRFAELGQIALATPRWLQALTWDPSLADDPAVLARVRGERAGPPALPVAPAADPVPLEPEAPVAPAIDAAEAPSETAPDMAEDTAADPAIDPEPDPPALSPTPSRAERARDGRHLSLGLGAGYTDGLLGLTLGWITGGHFSVEISVGLLYPTFDVRARWFVLDDALSPTLGAGLLMPLSPIDRGGAGLGAMDAIYELAESFHVDIGVAWMVVPGLDISATVSFVTPFDQVHPDTVVFFPQLGGHAAWRF